MSETSYKVYASQEYVKDSIEQLEPKLLPDLPKDKPAFTILPQVTCTPKDDNGDGLPESYAIPGRWEGDFEPNRIYKVVHNEKTYECKPYPYEENGETLYLLGNVEAFGLSGGNANAPFLITVFPNALADKINESTCGLVNYVIEEIPSSLVLSIIAEAVRQNPQFLTADSNNAAKWEDRTHWDDLSIIVPKGDYPGDLDGTYIFNPPTHPIEEGCVYTVELEGVTFETTFTKGHSDVHGETYVSEEYRDDQNRHFQISLFPYGSLSLGPIYGMASVTGFGGTGSTTDGTFKQNLYIYTGNVKTLDPKYLAPVSGTLITTILPTTLLTVTDPNDPGDGAQITTALAAYPSEGDIWNIRYNDVEYACQMIDVSAAPEFGVPKGTLFMGGNLNALDTLAGLNLPSNDEAPFVAVIVGSFAQAAIMGAFGMVMPIITLDQNFTLSITKDVAPQQLTLTSKGEMKWEERPFYEEKSEVVLVPLTECIMADDDDGDGVQDTYIITQLTQYPVAGQKVIITLNGVEYEDTLTEISVPVGDDSVPAVACGDLSQLGLIGGISAPFACIILCSDAGVEAIGVSGLIVAYGELEGQDITVEIKTTENRLKKLDSKFIDVPNIEIPNDNLVNGSAKGSIRSVTTVAEEGNYVLGNSAMALGVNTYALGTSSHAEGTSTIASGAYSHAEGYGYYANIQIILTGEANATTYAYSVPSEYSSLPAVGAYFKYKPTKNIAKILKVNADVGTITFDKTLSSTEIVNATVNDFSYLHGGAAGYGAHSEGNMTMALGDYSHAEGRDTIGVNVGSHTEGMDTVSMGEAAHAEGQDGLAFGTASHIEGSGTSFGLFTISGGTSTNIYTVSLSKINSLTPGMFISPLSLDSGANGEGALIIGVDKANSKIITDHTLNPSAPLNNYYVIAKSHSASGDYAHAGGRNTRAMGIASFTGGEDVTVEGSHAFGYGVGLRSHDTNSFTIGHYNNDQSTVKYKNNTSSSEYFSWKTSKEVYATTTQPVQHETYGCFIYNDLVAKTVAELTTNDYIYQNAIEYQTIVSITDDDTYRDVEAKTVTIVSYTESDGKALTVGNGADTDARSNAFTLDWDGNAWFSGDVYVGSTSGKNKDEGSAKLLSKKDYVLNSLTLLGTSTVTNVTDPLFIATEYATWKASSKAAFLTPGYRYPIKVNDTLYLITARKETDARETLGAYLGNLSLNTDYSNLPDSGEPILIQYYPDSTDSSSSYLIVRLSSELFEKTKDYHIAFYAPVTYDSKTTAELATQTVIDDAAYEEIIGYLNNNCYLVNGSAKGSLRSITSAKERDDYTMGLYSTALGYETEAAGKYGFATGYKTKATNTESYAEGDRSISVGTTSHAEGRETVAHGTCSHTEGSNTFAYGTNSHAEGESVNHGYNFLALSAAANSTELNVTMDDSNPVSLIELSRVPQNTIIRYKPENSYARIVGIDLANKKFILDQALSAEAIETNNIESDFSFYEGVAIGRSSHKEGNDNFAIGDYSHVENSSNIAEGKNSHAEGWRVSAKGQYSHAEGRNGVALGESSHVQNGSLHSIAAAFSGAKGSNIYTLDSTGGWAGADVGNYLEYNGRIAKVLDYVQDPNTDKVTITLNTTMDGENDLNGAYFTASHHVAAGRASTVIGQDNIAEGAASFAGGLENKISGTGSFGFGQGLISKLNNNFCIGKYNQDNDQGTYTEITETNAGEPFGYYSKLLVTTTKPTFNGTALYTIVNPVEKYAYELVAGDYVLISYSEYIEIASALTEYPQWGNVPYTGTRYQIACGQDEKGSYAFVIGNGDYSNGRSNAHTTDWNGNGWYKGNVYVGGTSKENGSPLVSANTPVKLVVSETAPSNPVEGTLWIQI